MPWRGNEAECAVDYNKSEREQTKGRVGFQCLANVNLAVASDFWSWATLGRGGIIGKIRFGCTDESEGPQISAREKRLSRMYLITREGASPPV